MKTTITFEFATESEAAYFLANHGAPAAPAPAQPQYAPQPNTVAAPYVPPNPMPAPAAYQPPAAPQPQAYAPAPAPGPAPGMAYTPQPQQQYAPAPGPSPAPAQTGGITVQQVTAAAQAYSKVHGAKGAKAVMQQYGITTVAQLDPSQYANIMQSFAV